MLRSFDPVDSPSRGCKHSVGQDPVGGLRGCQSAVAALLVDVAGWQTGGPYRPEIVGCVGDWRCDANSNWRALPALAAVVLGYGASGS
jgi:hypothetical protein